MKDLFVMTRRERRGMALILVAVALMLLAAVAARCHRDTVPAADTQTEISRFESETDSAAVPAMTVKPERGKTSPSHSRGRSSRPSTKPSKKPSPEPRRLDPVPGF